MPRAAKEMSALDVKRFSHPGGRIPVSVPAGGVQGLYLQCTANNSKSWVLRATVGDRRRRIGLGSYPDVTLAQARERAREAKDQIFRGIDPIKERRTANAKLRTSQARGLTLREAVDRYVAIKGKEFSSDKHRAQWGRQIMLLTGDALGEMQIDQIEMKDVLKALEPHWFERTDTARRVGQRLERVFDWAEVAEHRSGANPARWKGGLAELLPQPKKVAKAAHHPALALADVSDWFSDLHTREGTATRALEFLAMTAARSGEVRGMVWSEVDLEAGLWTIPADRMKASKEHRVPLTAEAVALLKAMPRTSDFVFAAPRGGQLSDMSLSATMRRINEARPGGYLDQRSGRPAVPHGLRSTFRDWAAEATDYPRELAEISLAHSVGSEVERAYRRGDQLEKRRAMMAAWGRFLRGESTAKVVRLKS